MLETNKVGITFTTDVSLGAVIQTVTLVILIVKGLMMISGRMDRMEIKVDTMWDTFRKALEGPWDKRSNDHKDR